MDDFCVLILIKFLVIDPSFFFFFTKGWFKNCLGQVCRFCGMFDPRKHEVLIQCGYMKGRLNRAFTLLMSIIRWTACVGLFPFDRKIGRKYSRYLSTLRKAKGSKFINNFPRFSSTSSYWEDSCSCQTSWLEAALLSLEAVEFHLVRKVLNIHKFIKFVHYISRRRNGIKDFPLRSTPGKL